MKIHAIQQSYVYPIKGLERKITKEENLHAQQVCNALPTSYYPINISFGKIKNSETLRDLFKYGIPDMYSPIITIDPKKIARMMDTDAFEVPLKKFVQVFKQFEPSLFEEGNETELYKIIKNYS